MAPWMKASISKSSGILSRICRISVRLSSLAQTTLDAPICLQNSKVA